MSLGVGVIGCGNISEVYFVNAKRFRDIRIVACADIDAEAARGQAGRHGAVACGVADLLKRDDVDIVLNLTIPEAHAEVSLAALEAGKHVYSEKPLATTVADGARILAVAKARELRVGGAPDTILGAGYQIARRAIDAGRIGRPLSAVGAVMSHGMEHWHPNPEFFFKRGGGPVLDIGPYYVTQLVNLLGPVERVAAQATMGSATRTVSSEPLKGSVIHVEVPTTVNGLLSFANGASATITTSWDVWKHRRAPFELYGTEGSMLVPDPNFFGGEPMVTTRDGDWMPLEISAHPFGKPNRRTQSGLHVADYRMVGVLDMAAAIRGNRKHRASGELAMHVLEVLDALERSSIEGRRVMIETPCDRPEPLLLGEGEEVFAAT